MAETGLDSSAASEIPAEGGGNVPLAKQAAARPSGSKAPSGGGSETGYGGDLVIILSIKTRS